MKLSDAMMLGSVTCVLEPANWNTCALGSAANAIGIPPEFDTQLFGEYQHCGDRWESIAAAWPWLDEESGGPLARTMTSGLGPLLIEHYFENDPDWGDEIWFRFDGAVCEGSMTFEQLVDYVRSIEPECGECNRFVCTCAAATEATRKEVEVAQ